MPTEVAHTDYAVLIQDDGWNTLIAGDGVPFPTVESGADPAPDGPATFPTGWFTGRDRAYRWLAS